MKLGAYMSSLGDIASKFGLPAPKASSSSTPSAGVEGSSAGSSGQPDSRTAGRTRWAAEPKVPGLPEPPGKPGQYLLPKEERGRKLSPPPKKEVILTARKITENPSEPKQAV